MMSRNDLPVWQDILRSEDMFLCEPYRKMTTWPLESVSLLAPEAAISAVWRISDEKEAPDQFLRIDKIVARNSPSEETFQVPLPALTVSPRAAANTHLIAPATAAALDFDIALEKLEEIAVAQGARTVAFPYVPWAEEQLRAALDRAKYQHLEADDSYTLHIDFANFESYLARFSSSRRQSILRERRKISKAGVDLKTLTFDEVDTDLLAKLESNLQSKYGRDRDPAIVAEKMETLASVMPENVIVFQAELDAVVLGFVYMVFWHGSAYPRWVGFNYDAQGNLPIYFELLFYRAIEESIKRKIWRIEYSIGSDVTKLSRGCTPMHQTSYWKVLNDKAQVKNSQLVGLAYADPMASRS